MRSLVLCALALACAAKPATPDAGTCPVWSSVCSSCGPKEFCEVMIGGEAPIISLPDAGVCPMHCVPTTLWGSPPGWCQCFPVQCVELPKDCHGCDCLPPDCQYWNGTTCCQAESGLMLTCWVP